MLAVALAIALAVPVLAQEVKKSGNMQVTANQEMKVSGVIVKREADTFTLRDSRGSDVVVTMKNDTQVKEKKSNPFRSGKNYATTQLLRGLNVEVKGRGDSAGTSLPSRSNSRMTTLKSPIR